MIRFKLIILFTFILIGCNNKPKDKYEDLYQVIDEFLRFNNHDADIVIMELSKVQKYDVADNSTTNDTSNIPPPPPPPPPGFNYFDKNMFVEFYRQGLLDSLDIDYLYNQINPAADFNLDSTKIIKPVLRYSYLKSIRLNYGLDSMYNFLKIKYKSYNYIKFSMPLFTKDGNKMLLAVDKHCGGLCGWGMRYLLEKKDNKWRIIYSKMTWES